jgi:hypothetical protein
MLGGNKGKRLSGWVLKRKVRCIGKGCLCNYCSQQLIYSMFKQVFRLSCVGINILYTLHLMSNTTTIQAGIPIPLDSPIRKYDFRSMKVGDSFTLDNTKLQYSIHSAIKWYNERNGTSIKLKTSKRNGIVTVWRIK